MWSVVRYMLGLLLKGAFTFYASTNSQLVCCWTTLQTLKTNNKHIFFLFCIVLSSTALITGIIKLLTSCLELLSLRTIYISGDVVANWTATNLHKARREVTWWLYFVLMLLLWYARNDLKAAPCYPSVNCVTLHAIFILLSALALCWCWHEVAVVAILGMGKGGVIQRVDGETAVVVMCVCFLGRWLCCHHSGLTIWHQSDKMSCQAAVETLRSVIEGVMQASISSLSAQCVKEKDGVRVYFEAVVVCVWECGSM